MFQKKFENKILQKLSYWTKKVNEVITYNQYHFVFFNILIFIFLSAFSFDCKKSNPEPNLNKELTDPKYKLEILKDQEILKSEIKKSYKIQNSSPSVEKAIQIALTEIRDNPNRQDDSLRYSCSPEEIRKIYLPNNVNQNNITANSKIEDSMYLIRLRRTAGLDKIRKQIQNTNGNFKILPLSQPYNIRKLTNINGYIIGEFDLQIGSKTIRIEEIKLVIEHKNQFKVCTYGT
ncbi:LA3241 family PerA/PerB upregulated protein [Leptospira kirschneri]|uniref:LA3241 family PerA/PerB upregulated protein n=1 Tax=Leptospira kirschneri TaxID=29507 RepID=UPI0003168CA1|nr:hypothetical protein [Leptospira kirschneri]KON76218.1 Uncharacterized protein NV38_0003115 [Leptospira kirschneri serovar Mozdok]KPZ77434.1 hypothetical protein APS47_12620 [Leptospira kirschneri serovar Mozdok]